MFFKTREAEEMKKLMGEYYRLEDTLRMKGFTTDPTATPATANGGGGSAGSGSERGARVAAASASTAAAKATGASPTAATASAATTTPVPSEPIEDAAVAGMDSPTASTSGSGLPPGWTEQVDPGSGSIYYFNEETGDSTWDVPTA